VLEGSLPVVCPVAWRGVALPAPRRLSVRLGSGRGGLLSEASEELARLNVVAQRSAGRHGV
jgi:hypothetical protein